MDMGDWDGIVMRVYPKSGPMVIGGLIGLRFGARKPDSPSSSSPSSSSPSPVSSICFVEFPEKSAGLRVSFSPSYLICLCTMSWILVEQYW